MSNFEDFDLDLRSVNNKDDEINGDITTSTGACFKSIMTCAIKISEALKCTPGCPVPTKNDRPVASCHKNNIGDVQLRC